MQPCHCSWQYGTLKVVFDSPSHELLEKLQIMYDGNDKGVGLMQIARKYGVSPNQIRLRKKTRDELDQQRWAFCHYERHLSRLQKIRTADNCEVYRQIKAFYENLRSRGRAVSIKTLCVKFGQLMPSRQLSQSAIYQRIRRFATIFLMLEDGFNARRYPTGE